MATVPGTRTFTYTNPISGLPISGGGTITLAVPGLRESGNTVTVSTVAAHGRVGRRRRDDRGRRRRRLQRQLDDHRPSRRRGTFTFTNPTAGLANSGGGTMTFISPFNLRVAGNTNNSVLINSANYSNAGLTAAFAGITGFAGTATVTGTRHDRASP